MSDPTDPLSDIAKSVAAVLALLAAAFAWVRGFFDRQEARRREEHEEARRAAERQREEAQRAAERAELKAAIDAVGAAVTKLEIAWQKSDRELALIAHTLGEKSARSDRMEGRLDELEARFSELELDFARSRGFDSGVRKSPSP